MNPVSELNVLRQGIVYKLQSRTGSDHEPVFTVTVELIYHHMKMFPSTKSYISRRLTVKISWAVVEVRS